MRIHGVFRGIGSFAVKFRWFVLVAWVIAAIAIPRALPSLSSVTQGNNANFLPASAPSEHALNLAAPLGGSTLTPVPVVAASTQGTLTQAEQAWLQKLQQDLGKVPTVVKVRDLGHSPDGQAAQLQVLSNVSQGGSGTGVTTLVKDLRDTIARDGPPSGLDVHLAGAVAIQVDQQAKSGNTDSQIQLLSIIFIIGLLLLVFRALLAPLVTLIPAVFAVAISGPLVAEAAHHGLKVSPLAQILLIVLVLGAGTDYGLFLVFRVRENLRQGQDRKQAVIAAVERVGESITFSAATVIAALLSLLFATFEFYSNLGIPLAIGIVVILLAGLTLLPALMAIFGRAVFWPSKTQEGTGKTGVWGRVSARIVRHPVPTLVAGLVVFGSLAFAVTAYTAAGFGGDTTAPAGSDSAAGTEILAAHFPNTSANPTNIIYQLKQPAWNDLQALETARSQLEASGLFTTVAGPLNPNGATLTPAQLTALHDKLGPPQLLPATPPPGTNISPLAYQLYRATALYISPDGQTVQFETGLKAGDPSTTAAMNAIPAVRAEAAAVADEHRRRGLRRRRRGPGHLRHQQHLQQRPGHRDPDRHRRHRDPARPGDAQPGRAALPDRLGRDFLPGRARPLGPALRRDRRGRRARLLLALPDVRLPAGAGRGLQHPGDEQDQGGGPASSPEGGGEPRARRDRHHGHLGRPRARRHVRRLRHRGRSAGIHPVP